uniref:Uncharacterized protein n=1 Tax=Oryza sativa subsp. japonica TaxID=39947 RepID=Q67W61_ORYSJ|nr:hypothetical protein [Oryza sativa Japonica Group]
MATGGGGEARRSADMAARKERYAARTVGVDVLGGEAGAGAEAERVADGEEREEDVAPGWTLAAPLGSTMARSSLGRARQETLRVMWWVVVG